MGMVGLVQPIYQPGKSQQNKPEDKTLLVVHGKLV